jgi:hypothetical protein
MDLQLSEREVMAVGMPCTEIVLALYMGAQLISGQQSLVVSRADIAKRCVLPMGFT